MSAPTKDPEDQAVRPGIIATELCPDVVVAIEPFRSISQVEVYWHDLEPRAAASFFLSWTWIGTWLEVSKAEPLLLIARTDGRLVGLGLLNRARRGRLGLRWPALSLNETGREEQDCIMIEDNGFLMERGAECATAFACLRYLAASEPDWRELRLSGVSQRDLDDAKELGLPLRIEAKRPAYLVDVQALSSDGNLGSLSANARQQINRSLRLYRERGEVVLRRSASLDEAMARFVELERLHQERWTKRGMPGAFGTPFFRRFHRALLTRGFDAGAVDVLRITAGSSTIGLLYTFFHGESAYAYQNGFTFEADGRLKPGLVSHLLAIEFCRDMGLRRYSLLAGDSRYKRSLASGSYELYWLSVRRPDLAFRLERIARRIVGREP